MAVRQQLPVDHRRPRRLARASRSWTGPTTRPRASPGSVRGAFVEGMSFATQGEIPVAGRTRLHHLLGRQLPGQDAGGRLGRPDQARRRRWPRSRRSGRRTSTPAEPARAERSGLGARATVASPRRSGSRPARRAPRRGGRGSTGPATLFVAFFTVPFLLFNVAPVLFGIYVSFTEWGIIGDADLGRARQLHARARRRVARAPPSSTSLLYALIIVPGVVRPRPRCSRSSSTRAGRSSGLARTLFFTPNVVSATVIGLVWVWLLDTQFGVLNHYLGHLGIGADPWLTSTRWSLVGVSIASIWWDLGLAFVLLPRGPAGRAARPARGGARSTAPAALRQLLARHPAAPAPGAQHGRDPAADLDHAHLQPGLRDDQRRPGRLVLARSSTTSTRRRSCGTCWATPRRSRCCSSSPSSPSRSCSAASCGRRARG